MDASHCDFVFSYHVVEDHIEQAFSSFFMKLAEIKDDYCKKCCIRILYNNQHTEHCLKVLDYAI